MKNLRFILLTILLLFITNQFNAQEASNSDIEELSEVVITASKFPIKKEHIGKSIVIISKESIEKMPMQTVANLINQVAGIEINGLNNSAGKNLGYYVRGGRSYQLLILIDGVPVTDPSGIGFSYDLNLLSLHQVESIEIMKGAASTLYGSGAAAGIVNIKLKKPVKERFKGTALFSIGTNNTAGEQKYEANTYKQYVDLSGRSKKSSYLFSFSNVYEEGISEAYSENKEGQEPDPFQQINMMGKLGHTFSDKFSINNILSLRTINHEYDFAFADSDRNSYKNKEFLVGVNPELSYNSGVLKGNLTYKSLDRLDTNEYGDSEFKSESITTDIFNKATLTSRWTLVSGVDFQYHNTTINSEYEVLKKENAHFYMVDPYITSVYQGVNGVNLNVGARLNIHENYGNHLVYNVNPSYSIPFKENNLKVMGSMSTAFITPSLYQLFSSFGNADLEPEESITYELGYEAKLLDKKLRIHQTYFYREEKNKIGFFTDFATWESFYYNQMGKQHFSGIENELFYTVNDHINLAVNFTYTTLDEATSFLIPKLKWNGVLNYAFNTKHTISLKYQYTGKRKAQDFREFPAITQKLASYQLVNLAYNSEIIKNRLMLFMDVNNIFDEKFIENLGYVTKGTNLAVGLKINF